MTNVALTIGIVSACIFALSWVAGIGTAPTRIEELRGDVRPSFTVIAVIWALSFVVGIIAFATAGISMVWK